ncbi:MAG TPA: M61 family peptidase [Planctomycetota bacterium]|nr:M61 family peptidase [Planctomycetota bacterium]
MPFILRAVLVALGTMGAGSAESEPPRKARAIEIQVDASDAARRIFHARLVIPCDPGPLTLLYPKWIPGEHGPTGPLADMAGFRIKAGGKTVAWRRDDLDLHAIHCEVPAESGNVEVTLDYLAPPPGTEGLVSAQASAQLAVFHWNQMLVYPKGGSMGEIEFQPSLVLPQGWTLSCALPVATASAHGKTFERTTLETLVDSPVLCGAHLREIPLAPDHWLALAGDSEAALAISDEVLGAFRRLVAEAGTLFGSRPYRSYRFFLTLSDLTPPFFLEHHECCDNRAPERTLLDETLQKRWLFVLPHEYVHSWNGKHRRPADMVTSDFQEAIATRLLWVYEGLTEYLGCVLAARSGIWTADQFRDNLALAADGLANQKGRTWRPLVDTTRAAPILYGARGDWASWRRGVDFYNEGLLLWLEVDAIIRQETKGKASIDDFCRRFHGDGGGKPSVNPYTFEQLVETLASVAPYDWKRHLTERVTSLAPEPPLGGVERGGWKLSVQPTPSEMYRVHEGSDKSIDLTTSIGLLLKEDGTVADIIPDKAADRARIGPGMKLVAVNARRWSADLLREAIQATRSGGPLELLVENAQFFRTYTLDYKEGARYPGLVRNEAIPDLLSEILKPRAK